MSSVSRRRSEPAGVRGRRLDMAPIVSFVGLVVAAVLSIGLLNGQLPLPGSGSAGPGGVTGPRRTPNPSVIFTPPPEERVEVRGTIMFIQRGSIWAASGAEIARLSSRAIDSMPTWSPDGETIYYIETREQEARAPVIETDRDGRFILRYPVVMSMDAAGSDRREVASGLVSLGGRNRAYFAWLRQPDVNPEGDTIALVSDAPEPLRQDVVLSLLPTEGGDVRNLGVPAESPFGHADPDWSPRGDRIAYTHFDREGALGTSRIALYDVRENAAGMLTERDFARPSWSPDGRFLAVEEIDGNGRDVAIIRVSDGQVVSRLTRDGSGVAPSWSPDGRQIAYLKVTGQNIDLHVLTLSDDGRLAVAGDDAITTDSVLDAASRPAWFMPPELISAPSRSPAASPSE
jgi:Tol biopolymer transport system component